MPAFADLGQVSLDEIKAFDDEARRLVTEFHVAGWRSYKSNNQHVFLMAPDGVSTAAVSRDSLRGRSGRNARAALTRWNRKQMEKYEAKQAAEDARVTAFGRIPDEPEFLAPGSLDVPGAVWKKLRNDRRVAEYIGRLERELGEFPNDRVLLQAKESDLDSWSAVDTGVMPPVVIAHGPTISADRVLDELRDEHPEMFPPEPKEADMAQMYRCEECGETFTTRGSVNLHAAAKHRGFRCTVEGCGETFKAPATLGAHRRNVHGISTKKVPRTDFTCRWCGKEFKSAQGVTVHEAMTHKGEPLPGTKRTRVRDVTVTSPPVTPEPAAATVVVDQLVSLPDGATATDMIARIRAIVTPPLMAELEAVRRERDQLRAENELLVKEKDELQTRMALLREALSV